MKIDTRIQQVPKLRADLFLELGFEAGKAERLHHASQKHLNDLKKQLIKQTEAARILMVSPTDIGCDQQKDRQSHY